MANENPKADLLVSEEMLNTYHTEGVLPVKDEVTSTQGLIKDTVGYTGKNVFNNTCASSYSYADVTYTKNTDKSVSTSGTASAQGSFDLWEGVSDGSFQGYIMTGCPAGGSNTTYHLGFYNVTNGTETSDFGSGTVITNDYAGDTVKIYIRVRNGQNMTGKVFKPMIRKADISDDTYEPYHDSVEVMHEEDIYGVNLLENTGKTSTNAGVTFTVNDDGSVSLSGATGDSSAAYFYIFGVIGVPSESNPSPSFKHDRVKKYKLTGGVNYNVELCWDRYDSATTAGEHPQVSDRGLGVVVDNDFSYSKVFIYVRRNTTVDGITVKPMIRDASIEDDTYRPYNYSSIQNQVNVLKKTGCMNFQPITSFSQIIAGITFTRNSDDTWTLSGTPTEQRDFRISDNFIPEDGTYKIIGAPGAYHVHVRVLSNNYSTVKAVDYGNGAIFTFNKATDVNLSVYIRVYADADLSSPVTIKSMITPDLSATYADYQPYSMTNRELTEAVTVEEYTLTVRTGYSGNAKARKVGNLVFLNFSVNKSDNTDIAAQATIEPIEIPAELKPKTYTANATAIGLNSSVTPSSMCRVCVRETSNYIQINNGTAAARYIQGSITYMIF